MSFLDKEQQIKEIEAQILGLEDLSQAHDMDLASEIDHLREKVSRLREAVFSQLEPWDKVCLARLRGRPTSLEYIKALFTDFIELHGDRLYGDDPSLVGGIGFLADVAVTVIAQQKGRDTQESIDRNFGMTQPEGYRKALRLMKQAEAFGRPVIIFVDTPGAFCGLGAEERGQGEAIANNLMEMSHLRTPIITTVIGEGGSGGALGLSVADRVFMLENATYSILSPEGFASILWKDASRAKEAAQVMKITAEDLQALKVIDGIIAEPLGGAHTDPEPVFKRTKETLIGALKFLLPIDKDLLVDERYARFRRFGQYEEVGHE